MIQEKFAVGMFKEIIGECQRLSEKSKGLIGFQGEHGAFGEVAAGIYDPGKIPIPCYQFSDVFDAVEHGQLDLGIVPVQNSLGGSISQINELLIEADLKIVGEVKLRINHCLLALPKSKYREIRDVYSHPQALSQCREFLKRQKLTPVSYYDTAGAAQMLLKNRSRTTAVIASKLCAGLYNLEVLKENIEDHHSNFTRFLILAREENPKNAQKCSVVFSTEHKAGALFSVLKTFADAGINLTRIESFPYRNNPGQFVFFLDFQSEGLDDRTSKILDQIKQMAPWFKYLGCYREMGTP